MNSAKLRTRKTLLEDSEIEDVTLVEEYNIVHFVDRLSSISRKVTNAPIYVSHLVEVEQLQ